MRVSSTELIAEGFEMGTKVLGYSALEKTSTWMLGC